MATGDESFCRKQGCKPFSGGIHDQFMSQRPEFFASVSVHVVSPSMKRKPSSFPRKVPSSTPVKSKRLSRRERFLRVAEIKSKHAVIIPFLNAFSSHWFALVFWPLLGLVWGTLHSISENGYEIPIAGALLGGAVGLFFNLGNTKLSLAVLAIYCSAIGGGLAVLSGVPENAMLFASIGLVIGLLGRYLVGLILQLFSN